MSADSKFITLARDRFKIAETATMKQRERELADLRFYAGDQWDDDLLKSRRGQTIGSGTTQQVVPARPSLTINKTREPVRQVLNQERASDLAVELIPADDFGEATGPIDHSEIELREGLVRRIQRDSEASDARTWAFARSAIAGTGYWLVMTRYVPGKSADQEIYIERIFNQSTVLLDPAHEQPDGSDAEWGFYGTDMPWDAYKAEFPSTASKRNAVSSCDNDDEWRTLGDEAPGWFSLAKDGTTRMVRVMNYYYTERESKTLYHLTNGKACYQEELASLPQGVTVIEDDGKEQTHTQILKTIQWCKMDGCQKLEETEWPGHYLPIIKVVGEELQPYDAERRVEGIVRPMVDSCRGNNYIVSKFVERVGLAPIPPWMMAGGQDEGYTEEYNAANTRAIGILHYNQKDEFGQPAPAPTRTDVRSEVGDLAMGLQMFSQAIASTSVTPETALGNADPTVKSGKLAKLLLDQAQRGTSNFLDNLVRSMRHEARVVNDLLYPICGRPGRLARMMNVQGDKSAVIIGQPFRLEGQGKQARPVPVDLPGWQPGQPLPEGVKYYGLTPDADFNVAIKVSKNEQTRRTEVATTLGEVISASPEQMAVMGDIFWKYLDMPEHDDLEKRYKAMLAPPVQAVINGGEQPDSPQTQAKMAAMQQQMSELSEMADKNKADLQKTQIQEDAETKRTLAKLQGQDEQTRANNETKLAVAELGAKVDRISLFLEERNRLGVQDHEHQILTREQQHERDMAMQQHQQMLQQGQMEHGQALEQGGMEHQQALQQGDQQQQNALEQGAQGHEQALEQQAMQPEPQA